MINMDGLVMFIIIFIIMIIVNNYFARDIRSPQNLILISWLSMYGLYSFRIINFNEVSFLTHIYCLLTILIFQIVFVASSSIKIKTDSYLGNSLLSDKFLVFLGMIGLAAAYWYYESRFGFINLIRDPGYVRRNDSGGTGLLGMLVFLPTIMFVVIVVMSRIKGKLSLISASYLIVVFLYMVILPERTTLINTVLWSVFSVYIMQKKQQNLSLNLIYKYGVPFSLALTSFIGFFIFVSNRTNKSAYLNNITYAFNQQYSVPPSMIDPYIYITGNIPALDIIIKTAWLDGEMFKLSSARTGGFVSRLFQIASGSSEKYTANAEFVDIPIRFNTYTWLIDPISDFGLFGTFIYVAIIATMSGIIWRMSCENKTLFSSLLYGWVSTSVIFTIMTNKFSSQYYLYAIFVISLLQVLNYLSKFKNS